MKRILAIVLAVVMCAALLLVSACTKTDPKQDPGKESNQPKSSQPASNVTSDKPTESEDNANDGPPYEKPDFVKELVVTSKKSEHKEAESLPTSYTLVGSGTLPKIDNRGTIDCGAAEAITYMQFTNAVARYLKNKDSSNTWDPAADYKSCYSPKSTFFGTGVGCAYYMLEQFGALTNAQDGFVKNAMDVSIIKRNGKYDPASIAWKLGENDYLESMKYRISGYESICTSTKDDVKKQVSTEGYYDPETKGIKITTSDNGLKFLDKIKDALATGNVVVTQGYEDVFVTGKLSAASGTLGKAGDTVVPYAKKHTGSVAWQLAIVGYDDEIEFTSCGATMKGAFLVANSLGTSWGTNGYMWVMYDAFNTASGYEEFKLEEGEEREPVLDWFHFLYWDTDIVDTMPALYGDIVLDVSNRTTVKIEMLRADGLGRTNASSQIQTWSASNYAWKYELTEGYFNPAGEVNGEAVTGYYPLNFEGMLSSVPEGSTYESFLWGVKVTSTSDKYPVTVKSIHVKNAAGETVFDLDLGEGQVLAGANFTYVFDLGGKKVNNFLSGQYKLKNVGTGSFVTAKDDVGMSLVPGKEDNAIAPEFTYETKTGKNTVRRDAGKDNIVLDCKGEMKDGAIVMFQAANEVTRLDSQRWLVSFNDDGTFSFYVFNEKGAYYALAEVDGAYKLVRAKELTDNMKWTLERVAGAKETVMPGYGVRTDKGITLQGVTSGKKITDIEIKVFNKADGSEVLKTDVTASNKSYKLDLDLAAGTYIVCAYNKAADNAPEVYSYIVTVK